MIIEQFNAFDVKKLFASMDIKASKQKSQNFLVDPAIPEKTVSLSGIDKSCGVLEVGPGLGALTEQLCKTAGHVTAVELDKRLIPLLHSLLEDYENIELVQGDILKIDINKLISETNSELSKHVFANLPYSITTPVITRLIETDAFETMTLLMQKEVAERICAKPGTSEYGAFTVYVNYYTEPQTLFDVPPGCFYPRPKVTSSVVKLKIRQKRLLSPDIEKPFFRVVRAAFGQRRKTLVNALYAVFGDIHSKESITKTVTSCGFDALIRGEMLNINDFATLSERLFEL